MPEPDSSLKRSIGVSGVVRFLIAIFALIAPRLSLPDTGSGTSAGDRGLAPAKHPAFRRIRGRRRVRADRPA